ncbi:arginyl-tRNA synthetase [Pyrolobus fumarii 1A]|uniref:Arginine--tRNA ligase n=1 Tax=Pyrolobus fumarii (strain DSM 11204 / 1A) TaxID=694429 RepID=G0EGS0_PYRF1|nr:arginine--tRNA ligase [Pyrolobus fumarii]AEM39218.1 arginyl-tRNA synthetase [Pyrolobus fumarii 1A]
MESKPRLYDAIPHRLLARAVVETLRAKGVNVDEKIVEYLVAEPPRPDYGDFGIPLHRWAREARTDPRVLAEEAAGRLRETAGNLFSDVKSIGPYLNIRLNPVEYSKLVFEAARLEGDGYGQVKTEKPERIVVEHTSANPVHPLHIGHARNMALGDTLARMLRARGHIVQTRYYVNDMGTQVAVLAYGVMLLGERRVPEGVKPDHWLGLVYAITHTLADIQKVKKELEEAKRRGNEEEIREKQEELDKLVAAAARLRERDEQLFDRLAEAIGKRSDPWSEIYEIVRKYEFRSDKETVDTVRWVAETVLKGIRETMERFDALPEVWDWESELVWGGLVGEILERARQSPYFTIHKGAPALDLREIQQDPEVREKLELPKTFEIPPLILQRSDGTTLYTTRDIAYTLKKFREFNADRVINVIAAEQRLEQLQVRLALIALGYRREALNTVHYAYEMVNLPGRSMSGRRGEYVDLDGLYEAAFVRALEEVEKRNAELPREEKERIASQIAIGAIRFTLVSVSASKPITFRLEEALNFERNSAPYLQYTYARAHNILAKWGKPIPWDEVDYTAVEREPAERAELVKLLAVYPHVFAKAADELRPELLAQHLLRIADVFNRWYPKDPVIHEQDPGTKAFKLALVYSVRAALRSGLSLLGVPTPERM